MSVGAYRPKLVLSNVNAHHRHLFQWIRYPSYTPTNFVSYFHWTLLEQNGQSHRIHVHQGRLVKFDTDQNFILTFYSTIALQRMFLSVAYTLSYWNCGICHSECLSEKLVPSSLTRIENMCFCQIWYVWKVDTCQVQGIWR